MRFSLQIAFLMLLAIFQPAGAAPSDSLALDTRHDQPIGRHVSYLQETGERLSLEAAVAAYRSGAFTPGRSEILNFGIGAEPVWLHIRVTNAQDRPVPRVLAIETAWLDRVAVYFRHDARTRAAYRTGDSQAYAERPVDSRYFRFNHRFPPGSTEVFIRVQTPDPMVVPVYLLSREQARSREQLQDYSYGFLYGFLFALLAYNIMLYAGLREAKYFLYSLYLGMFLMLNIAYTGHGYRWLWPEHTGWAQWANPILMVLYAITGLLFALSFLRTRMEFPRVHKAVLGYIGGGAGLLALAVVLDSQRHALLVAFPFVFLFAVIMLALGVLALRTGQKPARYFLLAALSAMVGAAVTALAVWGFIPTNLWTYRAVDIGMLLDATLLALALTYQFRVGRDRRLHAEELARLDPLTGLNNRRSFVDKAAPVWNIAVRHDHALAVILMDIDCFKRINDTYGHAYGDEVLTTVSRVLADSVREQDVTARWGGEEFILLLPETELADAVALAERLRVVIESIRLQREGDIITVTSSFGVAQREPDHQNLDMLISAADKYLYQAKNMGRNRVSSEPVLRAG